jgi:hypothetical protein
VGLSPGSPPGTCSGKFDGHRTHGDFIASIDYTTGGSIGTFSLAQWHCNVDTSSADNAPGWITNPAANPTTLNGTVCDFAAGTSGSDSGVRVGSGPHYQEVACVDANLSDNVNCPGGDNQVCIVASLPAGQTQCAPGVPTDAIKAVTNSDNDANGPNGPVPCGGWACRSSTGALATQATISDGTCSATAVSPAVATCIDSNELMEGGVNLLSLGFTGCISTFIPHTRSSQSFTATTKDFEIIPFNTCVPSTTLSLSTSPTPNAGSDILVHKGDSVTFTFTDTNDSSVGTPPLLNPSVTMSSTPAGATCSPVKTGGDTNNDGKLDRGEAWTFACSVTFNTTGSFTIKGTAHGTFNGQDVTFCADPNNPPSNTICDQDEQTQIVVRVITPSTSLSKSASPTSGVSPVSVTYSYTETNGSTGGNGTTDLAISNVSITDDKCSPVNGVDVSPADGFNDGDTNTNNKLDVGETWAFTCGPKSLTTTTTNTATASGTDALVFTVTFCADPSVPPDGTICSQSEQASATVTVIHPSTSLVKTPHPVTTVTYSYTEQNTGDVDLHDVSVSDDKCPASVVPNLGLDGIHNIGDVDNDGILDKGAGGAGETWSFHCTLTVTVLDGAGGPTSVTNTATAHATATVGGADTVLTETASKTVTATVTVQ